MLLVAKASIANVWLQATVGHLTELLLQANGDIDSEAGRCVSKALLNWEIVVGAKRYHNRKGLREIFSQPPEALDPDCDPAQVKSALFLPLQLYSSHFAGFNRCHGNVCMRHLLSVLGRHVCLIMSLLSPWSHSTFDSQQDHEHFAYLVTVLLPCQNKPCP